MQKFLIILLSALSLTACINELVPRDETFKKTQVGAALYSCVAGSGNLDVKTGTDTKGSKRADARLTKENKEVLLQFEVRPDLNQAKLVGAEMKGEPKLTKMSLYISLELMCGAQLTSQILPDEAKALNLLKAFR